MKTYQFTEELVNQILGYLGNRPYVEVAVLVSKILQVTKDQEEGKKKDAKG